MSHSTDDELMRLVLRILRLRTKISTQLDDLNQKGATQEPKEFKLENNLSDLPAVMKSLRVNYNNEDFFFLPDHNNAWESSGTPEFKTLRVFKKQLEERESEGDCEICKFKEGMEELLNILSICGFVKKPSVEDKDQEMDIKTSGVRETGKSTKETTFYY